MAVTKNKQEKDGAALTMRVDILLSGDEVALYRKVLLKAGHVGTRRKFDKPLFMEALAAKYASLKPQRKDKDGR